MKANKNILFVLIKKQFYQSLTRKKNKDFLGSFLYVALIGALIYIFLSLFSEFIHVYCNIKFFGQTDFVTRQYELLSIAYFVALILTIFSSISSINKTIFDNLDIKIMTAMPISPAQMFWSKMIVVYIRQIIVSFIVLSPINFAFLLASPQPPYYYIMSIIICFIFPLVAISLASVFALPAHYIKSFLSNKYLLTLIIISIVTTLSAAGYAYLVDKAKYLVIKGEMSFILNESTMNFFASLAKFCVPANLFASLVLGQNATTNLAIILGVSVVCVAISLILVKYILNRAMQNRLESYAKPIKMFNSTKQKPLIKALVAKEFNTVFRSPSYTFLYFSMAIAMPVMAGLCMSMGVSFIKTIILAPINFEIALFLTLIFGVLTNTFCSTNISRDGATFFSSKAMPISIKQVIFAKLILCATVTLFSSLLSVLIFLLMSYISFFQGIYIFLLSTMLSIAQICFATRLDFNRPKFSSVEGGQIKDSNTTMSIIIVTGLACALVIGFSVLYLAIMSFFKPSVEIFYKLSILLVLIFATIMALISYKFLMKNLEQKYYEFSGSVDYE